MEGRENEGLRGDLPPREDTDDGGHESHRDVSAQSSEVMTGSNGQGAGHVASDLDREESQDITESGGQTVESGQQSAGMGERDTHTDTHNVVVQRQPRLEGKGGKQGSTGTSQPPEQQVVGLTVDNMRGTV